MARSYRKPYSAVTGVRSAHADKTQAARSVRRAQNLALKSFIGDWDEFLIPHKYECSDNDVWGWGRDGNQYYRAEPRPNEHWYWFHGEFDAEWFESQHDYWVRIQRK